MTPNVVADCAKGRMRLPRSGLVQLPLNFPATFAARADAAAFESAPLVDKAIPVGPQLLLIDRARQLQRWIVHTLPPGHRVYRPGLGQ
jgi:hypothetical protein